MLAYFLYENNMLLLVTLVRLSGENKLFNMNTILWIYCLGKPWL